MSYIDDLFKNMRSAPIKGGGQYMQPGLYQVELQKLLVKISEDPQKDGAKMFICEFKVVKSSTTAHAVGSTGSWVGKFDKFGLTLGNIKALIFAATGFDQSKPSDHVLVELFTRAVLDDSSPAVAELAAPPYEVDDPKALVLGQIVALECQLTKTKKGGDFTVYNWSRVEA